jgi:hypothetical protein
LYEAEGEGVGGRQRREHPRLPEDPEHAERRDRGEPEGADRPEHGAHRAGAAVLRQEQRHQDRGGERDHRLPEGGRDHLQALDGGEHRDRRGDDAVAEEQAGAGDADQGGQPAPALGAELALRERRQRQDAALVAVVRAQD